MPNFKCTSCAKFLSSADSAKCCKCAAIFHRGCAKGFEPKHSNKWTCRTCMSPPTQQYPSTNSTPNVSFVDANAATSSPNQLTEEMRLLREAITTVCTEMKSLREEVVKLNTVISEVNKRVDTVEQRVAAMEVKLNARATDSSQDPAVTDLVAQLRADLNDREQENLLNDVQIAGLPETPGENVTHLVDLIGKKIGITIMEYDIVSVTRKGFKRTDPAGGDHQKPRPVVVRLARRAVRDGILQAARVRRGVDTTGVLEGPPRRIHINEHLTRCNRALFYKAREEGRRLGWRYIWTRGGTIFARHEPGSQVHRIRTDRDLDRIFGPGIVGRSD